MEKPSVLIIEPENRKRKLLGQRLAGLGYEAIPAVDVAEGIRFAEGLGPTVIVADAALPELVDVESLERLARVNGRGSLVLLGSPRGQESEVPEDVRWIPAGEAISDALLEKLRLVLVGKQLRLEPDPRLEALVGDLTLHPPLELIRALHRVGFTGRLVLERGEVSFDAGEVTGARAGRVHGIKAFCRLGRLLEGPFRVWPSVEAPRSKASREIDEETDELVIRAVEDVSRGELPHPRTRLELEVGPAMFSGDFTARQQEILTAADRGTTTGEILDAFPVLDGEILEDLRSLVDRGLLKLVEPEARVQVVTDSTADLPLDAARRLGVEVVPLTVIFGDRRFLDGVELRPKEFYELLEGGSHHPSTEPPPEVAFQKVYRRVLEQRDVLSLHISSKLSETLSHARGAAGGTLDQLPGRRQDGEPLVLEAVDSHQVSLGLGMLAMFAARMSLRGHGAREIADRCREMAPRFQTLFVVNTLEFLQRGGRIGKARAWFGELLRIKPILSVEEGEVVPVDRVRGGRAAHARIIELLRSRVEVGRPLVVGVAHAKAPVWAERLEELIRESFPVVEMLRTEIGPVVGTHAGPGTVGCVAFQPTDEEMEWIAPIEERRS